MKNPYLVKKPKDIFYRKDILYSITVNPDDKFQYLGKSDRMQSFRNLIAGIFVKYPQQKTDYYLMVELSEPREVNPPGVGPRLHIHGMIRFNSNKAVKQFLLTDFYQLTRLGHVDIDVVNDFEYWDDYIHKQFVILQEFPISNYDSRKLMIETFKATCEAQGLAPEPKAQADAD